MRNLIIIFMICTPDTMASIKNTRKKPANIFNLGIFPILHIHTEIQLFKLCAELKLSCRFSTFQLLQVACFQHMTNVILSHCCHYSAQIAFLTSLCMSIPSFSSKHQIQAVCFQFYNPSHIDFTIPIIAHKIEKKKSHYFPTFRFSDKPYCTFSSAVCNDCEVPHYPPPSQSFRLLQFMYRKLRHIYCLLSWQVFPVSLSLPSLVLHSTTISLCVCAMPTVGTWSAT